MTETLSRNCPEGDREGTEAGYKKKLIQKQRQGLSLQLKVLGLVLLLMGFYPLSRLLNPTAEIN